MSKRSIFNYLTGTFLLAFIAWGIIITAQELRWFQYGSPISMILLVIGANAPAIIAYFVFKGSEPKFGLKKYLKDAFALKQKPIYYAVVILLIAVSFVVPALMGGIIGELPPVIGGTESTEPISLWITVIGIPLFFFLGGSEELGWRYLLQPALEKRMSFVFATIIIAVIWSVWHLPLFFITGTSQNSTEFLPFVISIFGSAFASAAIYRISGSVCLCILFHCATNSLQGTWSISDDFPVQIGTAIVLIALSMLIVLIHMKNTKNNTDGVLPH